MNILDFFKKNENFFSMNILDSKKRIIVLNIYSGFILQKRSLQNVSNHPGIISGPDSMRK